MRYAVLAALVALRSGALSAQRPVTVDDMIAVRAVGAADVGQPLQDVGVFSPDGRRFIVVVREPDLRRNVVRSLLLVFRTDSVFRGGRADTALVLASGSNSPAIASVSWLPDNETLTFLGARDTMPPQVYRFDLRTRRLAQVTHVATGIEEIEVGPQSGAIVYQAVPAPDLAFLRRAAQTGFFVDPQQSVDDLMEGRWDKGRAGAALLQTFVLFANGKQAKRVTAAEGCYGLTLSPDSQHAIASCPVSRRPDGWSRFTDSTSGNVRTPLPYALHVIDLASDNRRLLIDAPAGDFENFAWARDGRSLVITDGYLPVPDPMRHGHWYGLLEVDIASGAVTPIDDGDTLARPVWNPANRTVSARRGLSGNGPALTYRWIDRRWVSATDETLGECN